MNPGLFFRRLSAGLISLLTVGALVAQPRETQRLDAGWIFHAGDVTGAEAREFDTTAWSKIELPHDWSISGTVDAAAPAAGHGGFFPTGIGWYRRSFTAPQTWAGRRVTIEFEGVATDASVWINGVALGRHPYGYTPFSHDLTPHLKLGTENVIAVRADTSVQPNTRWYAGSGLYRTVWLRVTDAVHLEAGSAWAVTTELNETHARVRVSGTVKNETAEPAAITVDTELRDTGGRVVARGTSSETVAAGAEWTAEPVLEVTKPKPWSPESPTLYRAVMRVRRERTILDEVTFDTGLRTVRVSAERGFELNGRSVKLFGGNVHHDNGVLGAAAFDRAEERKAELLKAAGFNAVRTAHNPPSVAFLRACDRLGLLVMDEAFDGWEKAKNKKDYSLFFKEWWQRDLDAMVRRDRAHPCVVVWSVGNEMFERGNAGGLRVAQALVARIRELDPTRPITAGVNGLGKSGEWTQLDPLFATFDLAGYNYELAHHATDHERLPGRVMLVTESYQNEVFANWAVLHDHPYVVGDFVWSALDYLGEAGIGRVFPPGEEAKKHWEGTMFPWHGAACGDIDLTGWRKPISHYRAIVWDRGEKLYAAVLAPAPGGGAWNLTPWSLPPMLPSWNWPGHEGQSLTVEVYSKHESVRLMLNGRTLAEKPTTRAQEFKAVFEVPYAPGELRVAGGSGGREVETFVLKTAGAATTLRLVSDRATLRGDGQDLAFVTVEALDAKGVWQPLAAEFVTFAIEGAGALAGAGSADLTAMASYQSGACNLHQGRAIAVIRAGKSPGRVTLNATAPGLAPAKVVLRVVKP